MQEFSKRLQEIAVQNGWTKKQLAETIGIAHQTLSGYLADRNSPKIDDVVRFADKLGVSVAWLCGEDKPSRLEFEPGKTTVADIVTIIDALQRLDGFEIEIEDRNTIRRSYSTTTEIIGQRIIDEIGGTEDSTVEDDCAALWCDNPDILDYYRTYTKLRNLVKEGHINQMEFQVMMDGRRKLLEEKIVE